MNKKLYKIEEGKKLCGVCGGIAEYFDVDPTIIRLLWVFLVFCAGTAGDAAADVFVADVDQFGFNAFGFKNADHFSKCFKEQYHVTPTAFRRTAMLV